ncbi:solute carrier family 22 member 3-like [Battus philenor]|uniref:solute carrier family 22 member 3-like n=1 Tax=Battus philenor TaxID=42288 RepID=UPI0035CFB012
MAEDEPRPQLDAVLEQLGAFGKHQLLTMSMLALVYATNSMYNVNYVFVAEEVGYRCAEPAGGASLQLNASGPAAAPRCAAPCARWQYDEPHSFVAEYGLACEEWKPPLVGTAHMLGNMLGLLLQGQISDRLGRKAAAVFAGTAGALLGLAKSFAGSFWTYVALEALEAAVGDALSPMFMLSIEIIEKKRAVFYQMILLNCYTAGLVVMPMVAWAVPYWRHFLRAIYAPTLLIATYALFLDESIRWLFSKGKTERATQLIEKIARRNKVQLDKTTLARLDYVDENSASKKNDWNSLRETFKSRIMMQRFLVCLVWWFTITLINYGMMISSVLIAGNKYVNFALLMLMDVPANVFYWLALARHRRRLPLLFSFVLGGLFCVAQPFVSQGHAAAGLALFLAFEMLATFSYNIVYMYTSELFPTCTRNSMHAACSAAGRGGALLAPQTPLLMGLWTGLPALVFGAASLVSGALCLLMPETARCPLPDTVRDAEAIGSTTPLRRDRHDPSLQDDV